MYSVKEVAEMLGKNPETVRRWIRSGDLKSIRSKEEKGCASMIEEKELIKFLGYDSTNLSKIMQIRDLMIDVYENELKEISRFRSKLDARESYIKDILKTFGA